MIAVPKAMIMRVLLLLCAFGLATAATTANAAPNTVSISPNNGPITGGTPVTLTGTGYLGSTGVTIGGIAATNVVVVSDTQITATTPAQTVGAKAVRVQNPSGPSNQPFLFTYNAPAGAPTLTSITPNSGPVAGGTTIVITGTGFTGASAVTIGGNAVASYTINSDTQITATTPASTVGLKGVAVTNTTGTGQGGGGFTYVAAAVTAISPDNGPEVGGTSVTITGTLLTGTTDVKIGGLSAVFTVLNDTTINATTPAGTAGSRFVQVFTPNGTVSKADFFTYTAPSLPPTISAISPANGTTGGGTTVTITGTNFSQASAVTFGGISANSVTYQSETVLNVVTPAGTEGASDVVVTTAVGTGTLVGGFTYISPAVVPTVTSIAPNSGTTGGGTPVTITGTGFTAGSTVTIDGNTATNVVFNSPTSLSAVTPAGTAGARDVVVTTAGGTGTGTGLFTYTTPAGSPTVSAIFPSTGSTDGGTTVTITGTSFTGATAVMIGGTAATLMTVDSDTQITATTPSGTAGAKDVAVTTANGTGSLAGVFTYLSPLAVPTVTSIAPNSGTTGGGTPVTITGTGFTSDSTVTVGGNAATNVVFNSGTSLSVVTPPGTAGARDVVVTTAGGTGTGTGLFTYTTPAAPNTISVTPNNGPLAGGTNVTLTGTGFTSATGVTFGNVAATNILVLSDTQITATTPPQTAGVKAVRIQGPNGTSNEPFLFSYVAPGAPTIGTVSPNSGSTAGGTTVIITGTNFNGATAVAFSPSIPAASFTVNSDTQITAVTATGTAGLKIVRVTNSVGVGSGTESNAFTYTAAPGATTVTGVAPPSGVITGGTSVTITGTGFTSATAVTIGGNAVTDLVIVSDTSITAFTPVGTVGAKTVAVTSPAGTGNLANGFTYTAPAGAPTLTSIAPNNGPTTGGTSITITGTKFTSASAVTVGGNPATGLIVNSDTQITAITPAGTAGAKIVTVTTAAGTGQGGGGFTYVSPAGSPTIASIAPNSGTTLGGTTVTITGTSFAGATDVTIGGNAATSVTVVNATTITAVTPPGTAGVKTVAVTTATGTGSGGGGFTYVAPVVDTGMITLFFDLPENGAVSISSATPALNQPITLANGQGSTGSISLPVGMYQFTVSGPSGLLFASESCGQGITFDGPTRTGTITLAANQDLRCTITAQDIRSDLKEAIGAFLETRARLVLVNEPSLSRRIQRLEGGTTMKRTVSAYGLPVAMAAPIALTVDQSKIAFATDAALGLVVNTDNAKLSQKLVSIWVEGSYSDVETGLGSGDFSIVHMGADYLAASNTLVGLGAQFDWAKIANAQSRINGSGFMVGPYVTHRLSKGFYFDARAAWGRTNNEVTLGNRAVQNVSSSRTLVSGGLTGSFDTGGLTIRPEARVSWYDETSGKFKTPEGILIDPVRFSTGQLKVGPELRYPFKLDSGTRITPFTRFDAVYLFSRNNEGVTSPTTARKLGNDFRMRISGGVDYVFVNGAAIGMDVFYDGIADGTYSSYGVKIGVQFGF